MTPYANILLESNVVFKREREIEMNATALLIGLGPLLGWGLFPTIASKIGGRPVNQILGTSLGTLIFAAIFQ